MTRDEVKFQIAHRPGIFAALDQSGGSTPGALRLYGVPDASSESQDRLFAMIHAMRERVMKAPAFTGRQVIAAILFEDTLRRQVEGAETARFLWRGRNVIPFLKIDHGLLAERSGVRLMKPIPSLDETLAWAVTLDVFGTKTRSVIRLPDRDGTQAVIDQQFELADRVAAKGLVPIIEPEVLIDSPSKAAAEEMLRDCLLTRLNRSPDRYSIVLKLTLPETPNLYQVLVEHPRVLRVLALSGGYERHMATVELAQNVGVIASFSRALLEDLRIGMSDREFADVLQRTIDELYDASTIKQHATRPQ